MERHAANVWAQPTGKGGVEGAGSWRTVGLG
jgi:hypothetical protein